MWVIGVEGHTDDGAPGQELVGGVEVFEDVGGDLAEGLLGQGVGGETQGVDGQGSYGGVGGGVEGGVDGWLGIVGVGLDPGPEHRAGDLRVSGGPIGYRGVGGAGESDEDPGLAGQLGLGVLGGCEDHLMVGGWVEGGAGQLGGGDEGVVADIGFRVGQPPRQEVEDGGVVGQVGEVGGELGGEDAGFGRGVGAEDRQPAEPVMERDVRAFPATGEVEGLDDLEEIGAVGDVESGDGGVEDAGVRGGLLGDEVEGPLAVGGVGGGELVEGDAAFEVWDGQVGERDCSGEGDHEAQEEGGPVAGDGDGHGA